MNTRDLLFELGTEELPPKALRRLMDALRLEVSVRLEKAGLTFAYIQPYATPRRLAMIIHELAKGQPDKTVERRGPALKTAFDAAGNPTPAALGFAKSCGVSVGALETLENKQGQWLLCRIHQPGKPAAELLPEILRQALAALPIPKRMRWGDNSAEFVRPVHWAVLMYGGEVIKTEILGITTGDTTRGHRFHCPRPLPLSQPDHYPQLLLTEGRVIADFAERRSRIRQQAEKLALDAGGHAHVQDDLLDEVTALVEWPVGLVGNFDDRFLALPKEVLITVMQSHQKYFPVLDDAGNLLPRFITFANLDSRNPATVRAGNERVIRPRLSDAEFFWKQDLKTPLERRLDKLAGIIFQKQVGTLLDKTHRLELLAETLAPRAEADPAKARRAALLAKTDLVTDMVGEFPELQGIMGRYYALAQGEDVEVAAALEEQYLPRFAGDALPKTPSGRVLALADKIDTLVGIFSIGLIPSGTKDPYALRRAALGVIRIVLEAALELDLTELLRAAVGLYPHDFDRQGTVAQLYDFICERLRGQMDEHGFAADEFEAVAALRPSSLLDFRHRIEAVHAFRQLPESESLAAANKRIRNILRQAQLPLDKAGEPDTTRFDSEAEQALYRELQAARTDVEPLLAKHDYTATLKRLARLRGTVDAFFDQVMVMVEDDDMRRNRLDLLAQVAQLFLRIADISRLQG